MKKTSPFVRCRTEAPANCHLIIKRDGKSLRKHTDGRNWSGFSTRINRTDEGNPRRCHGNSSGSEAHLDDESRDRVAYSCVCRERRARPNSAEDLCSLSRQGVFALFPPHLSGTSGSLST